VGDTSVAITPGSGAVNVDARSQPGGDVRQVVTIGDGDATPIAPVDASGLHVHAGTTATAPTPARLSDTTTSTQLLASNTARKGAVIHNDSDATLYVKYGTAASATSYVYKLLSQAHLTLPEPGQPIYTGIIHGLWSADTAAGAATVNEVT
jgi:hypothetical protein